MNILYSSGCPKCKVLKDKLQKAGVEFVTESNVDIMIEKGVDKVEGGGLPVFEIDGVMMNFRTANEWVKNYNKKYNKEV